LLEDVQHHLQEEVEEHNDEEEEDTDPYSMFVYAIRSPYTKESYFRRLRRFFESTNLAKGLTFEERCNIFAYKGRKDSKWAFNNILRFLQTQKQRVERKEITAGTLRNYVKTIKMFCEVTDVVIAWKKITRGLPRGKRYADDRAPTTEEIRKIIEYPDRRIKPLVYTMASSGIRVGAWDHLRWDHVLPIIKAGKLVAAKIVVYAGQDDEYFTFITEEAYTALESWMKYRSNCGEHITGSSWVMRDLWNVTKLRPRAQIQGPVKLQSIGVKRLVERALWAQGIRNNLEVGRKRHEFQTDHGFRKWYKTQCEIAGMKPINIEKLMGHSVGISDSYYRITESELLDDYLKAVNSLTITDEHKLESQIGQLTEKTKSDDIIMKRKIQEKDNEIQILIERDLMHSDAIASLSDQLMKVMQEIETLRRKVL
jgi:hypothetical protein